MTTSNAPTRTRLTDRRAAVWLTIALLAMPTIPFLCTLGLDENQWENSDSEANVAVSTASDATFIIAAPEGWHTRDLGDTAVLRDGDAEVIVRVFDLEGRNPADVTDRLMRANRLDGTSEAFDGGQISTADGALSGQTCIAVSGRKSGSCAYLTDDEVIVTVESLGTPDQPARSLVDIVAPLTREQP